MVKNFIRKLVAIVVALFLFCLAFCPPAAILYSNEIVETLLANKAIWLIALILVLCPTEKKATTTRTVEANNSTSRTIKLASHEIAECSQYETQEPEDDDETLISPR